ncbi:MAG TPA: phospholipase D-like domain-containing protein [Pirellulaceae bacterium]|nr:phospholipase D-like domain-containing protein [Pirellulaceae bacterium]
MIDFLQHAWPYLIVTITIVIAGFASAHALLYKRDPRAAIGWVGYIWFVPLFGSLMYLWLGINRIKRLAKLLRSQPHLPDPPTADCQIETLKVLDQYRHLDLVQLAHAGNQLARHPLLGGNQIVPLGRDVALPEMLQAIERAERSITLLTYIFDNDELGRKFVAALEGAVARGVEVRLIVDDVGTKYRRPSIVHVLRKTRIPFAIFMPRLAPYAFPYANLRNHRKLMVVDGKLAFTGGMNIRQGHIAELSDPQAIVDLHFRVTGPVVAQMQHVFAEDWNFCRGEPLNGELWFPKLTATGEMMARAIPDGPDEDLDTLRLIIMAGLTCARQSVLVATPYFLPDMSLIAAINLASLRGVQVDILIPERGNLRLVQWASTAMLWQVVQRGVRIWLTPPPFDHTKLMVVDRVWTLLGSTNWDPRSLRLNFEMNIECYHEALGESAAAMLEHKISQSRQVTLEELDGRSLIRRLRDGAARLFSPYL